MVWLTVYFASSSVLSKFSPLAQNCMFRMSLDFLQNAVSETEIVFKLEIT